VTHLPIYKDIRNWSEWGKYQVAAEKVEIGKQINGFWKAKAELSDGEREVLDYLVEKLSGDIRGLGETHGMEIIAKLLIYMDLRGGE